MKLIITIRGIRPLIINNGRMANPLEPWARSLKKITSKKAKTEQDYAEMAEVQFLGALYWDDSIGVYMPTENLQRMLFDACKKVKLGRQSIGIMVDAEIGVPIEFSDSHNLEKLKSEPRYRITKMAMRSAKVLVTRPMVPTGWKLKIPIELDPEFFDRDQLTEVAHIAGSRIGLGDWRPGAPKVPGQFGRFVVETIEEAA